MSKVSPGMSERDDAIILKRKFEQLAIGFFFPGEKKVFWDGFHSLDGKFFSLMCVWFLGIHHTHPYTHARVRS
jgi:hypothetical protein